MAAATSAPVMPRVSVIALPSGRVMVTCEAPDTGAEFGADTGFLRVLKEPGTIGKAAC